eukprot:scaffold8272_cov248-Pinguiococcus_pyrenoidosus.AAC.5
MDSIHYMIQGAIATWMQLQRAHAVLRSAHFFGEILDSHHGGLKLNYQAAALLHHDECLVGEGFASVDLLDGAFRKSIAGQYVRALLMNFMNWRRYGSFSPPRSEPRARLLDRRSFRSLRVGSLFQAPRCILVVGITGFSSLRRSLTNFHAVY